MKKLFLTFAVIFGIVFLSLNSCEQQPRQGADGYTFGEKQYEKNSVQISVVVLKSDDEMVAQLKRRGVSDPESVVAFSVLYAPNFDKCTIYMIDPAIRYEPEYVGHEFLHCYYGQWHTDNDSRG